MYNELITFETAKLANKKQFNISQNSGYDLNGKYFDNSQDYDGCKFGYSKEIYLTPTQSLLQRWLREKHNIHVECVHTTLNTLDNILYYCNIYNYENHHYLAQLNPIETKFYNNYEQALEEGLYEALKLIKLNI